MIVTSLIAATVAVAEPAPPAPPAHPAVAPAPTAEKKMACCEKMAKGEGCACCKGKVSEVANPAAAHGEHDH